MKKKIVLFTFVLAFLSLLAYAQGTQLYIDGVDVTLVNNGTTVRASGIDKRVRTIQINIHYADGSREVRSITVNSYGSYRNEGGVWRATGNIEKTAVVNLPKKATGISGLSTAQRDAAERERVEKERRETAERERREAAQRATAAAEAAERAAVPTYMDNGTAAFNRSDWDRAISEFSRVIRIDPGYAMAYNNRGAAYNGKRDWDRAITDFTEAIRLDPNYAAPYRHRAFANMQKSNFTQARTDVNKALQINPNYQNAKELSAELQRKGY